MILSVSRRTDIPCYYSEWFMNRLREGYVLTRNPVKPSQIYRIELSPETIDCIVFWTKDPQPLIRHIREIEQLGYSYYFQFTLTPYGRDLERSIRSKAEIEETFIQLSNTVGRDRIVWRYDPIILNDVYTMDVHQKQFMRMCSKLSGYTDTVVISFVDLYDIMRHTKLREATRHEVGALAEFISATASDYNLRVTACSETVDLTPYGIQSSSCIDRERIERIIGCPIQARKDRNQRSQCRCIESVDIGAYNTCLNQCVYCYANGSEQAIVKRNRLHNPKGALLVGEIAEGEKILTRACESNRVRQVSLFD